MENSEPSPGHPKSLSVEPDDEVMPDMREHPNMYRSFRDRAHEVPSPLLYDQSSPTPRPRQGHPTTFPTQTTPIQDFKPHGSRWTYSGGGRGGSPGLMHRSGHSSPLNPSRVGSRNFATSIPTSDLDRGGKPQIRKGNPRDEH